MVWIVGFTSINVIYPVYDVDVTGLINLGKLVAAGSQGLVTANPIYAGLLGIMGVNLDNLNTEIANATTSQRSVSAITIFTSGLTPGTQWPIFYEDSTGKGLSIQQMNSIYGVNQNSSFGSLVNCAQSFTLLSTCLVVQYQQTSFVGDQYGTQGYIGSYNDTENIFPSGGKVVDCGVFQISQNPPVH